MCSSDLLQISFRFCILLETDAPYLTPKNVPGLDRTNLPRNISYVARDVAKYMGVEEEVLKARAKENTERIFQVLP